MGLTINGKEVRVIVLNTNNSVFFNDEKSGVFLNAMAGKIYEILDPESKSDFEIIKNAIRRGTLLGFTPGGKNVIENITAPYDDVRKLIPGIEQELGLLKLQNDQKTTNKSDHEESHRRRTHKRKDTSSLAEELLSKLRSDEVRNVVKTLNDVDLLKEMIDLEFKGKRRKSILKALQSRLNVLMSGKSGEVVVERVEEVIIK
ncbi:hypothetical protein DRN58_00475 [Thermococci archaeon]|nr:MAG: hypothetical protein DRN58_00475 [Thermococci archaeon]